jgi:lipoprotein-anchoring transpeptidase ErfK/SrfK
MSLLSGWRPAVAAAGMLSLLSITPALADVVVHIDKSAQRMSVSVNGQQRYTWPVSTGRNGYGTPSGVFHPQMMARRWFSRKYYNSPMPHSIFFYHGFAIHGTTDLRRLGGPASHGCVRLHPANAAMLYALVERNGRDSTRIEIY